MIKSRGLKHPKKQSQFHCTKGPGLLGYKSLKYQYNNPTHMSGQKLPPPGKWYLCFQIDGESARSEQCFKSHVLTKLIYLILEIESFEQQFVIIKKGCYC